MVLRERQSFFKDADPDGVPRTDAGRGPAGGIPEAAGTLRPGSRTAATRTHLAHHRREAALTGGGTARTSQAARRAPREGRRPAPALRDVSLQPHTQRDAPGATADKTPTPRALGAAPRRQFRAGRLDGDHGPGGRGPPPATGTRRCPAGGHECAERPWEERTAVGRPSPRETARVTRSTLAGDKSTGLTHKEERPAVACRLHRGDGGRNAPERQAAGVAAAPEPAGAEARGSAEKGPCGGTRGGQGGAGARCRLPASHSEA